MLAATSRTIRKVSIVPDFNQSFLREAADQTFVLYRGERRDCGLGLWPDFSQRLYRLLADGLIRERRDQRRYGRGGGLTEPPKTLCSNQSTKRIVRFEFGHEC